MRKVRPTLRALRLIPQELLPDQIVEGLRRVATAADNATKIRILEELRLGELDVAMLSDARSRFAAGLPDQHRACSTKMKFPVYEVRDRTGQAWRGAVALDASGDPWLVWAADHDTFHRSAADIIHRLHTGGQLLPGDLDYRIRTVEEDEIRRQTEEAELLRSLIRALHSAVAGNPDQTVEIPGARKQTSSMTVSVTDVPAEGWDADDAHEHADVVTLCMVVDASDDRARKWLLKTCLRFLQPDPRQIESHYAKALTAVVMISRAKLIQLLADPTGVDDSAPPVGYPPDPVVLHYADRFTITRAFVEGSAVRAVCGQWWLPTGDESTHAELPICADCEAELPAARAIKQLLRDAAVDQ